MCVSVGVCAFYSRGLKTDKHTLPCALARVHTIGARRDTLRAHKHTLHTMRISSRKMVVSFYFLLIKIESIVEWCSGNWWRERGLMSPPNRDQHH